VIESTRYTLIWFSMDSMDTGKLVKVRRQIEDKIKEPQESVEIDLWLESPGGDAHTAYKLALIGRGVGVADRRLVTFAVEHSGRMAIKVDVHGLGRERLRDPEPRPVQQRQQCAVPDPSAGAG
jgi:hypothetical protein